MGCAWRSLRGVVDGGRAQDTGTQGRLWLIMLTLPLSSSSSSSAYSSSPRRLVGPGGLLRPLQLHLEPLGADLEAVHGGDRGLRRRGVLEGHEPEALGQVRLFVYEHLRGYHGAEGQEGGGQVDVGELLRQVVDEEVAALGTCDRRDAGEGRFSKISTKKVVCNGANKFSVEVAYVFVAQDNPYSFQITSDVLS